MTSPQPQGHLYLIGIGVTHSIAPPMHNTIATTLHKPWTFSALECPTPQSMLRALHSPNFVGAVITMPYKQSIIPYLSGGTDHHATVIHAVNNVYMTPDRRLRGTNTDWEGVRGCLLNADPEGRGRACPALVVGAGGACRAAVYALKTAFGVEVVYVLNRDAGEVAQLVADARVYGGDDDPASSSGLKIIHVRSAAQARGLEAPFYVVGTVPDIEARSEAEIEMRDILEVFLESRGQDGAAGVLLDMCFKPRETRMLKVGRARGWKCVQGTEVIGHQVGTQWGLWTGEGEAVRGRLGEEEAWRVLRKAAEESPMIN